MIEVTHTLYLVNVVTAAVWKTTGQVPHLIAFGRVTCRLKISDRLLDVLCEVGG